MTPESIASHLAAAGAHLAAGRLREADDICLQILAQEPGTAEAQRLLGVSAYLAGRHEEAETLLTASIRCVPTSAAAYDNLGLVLKAQGRIADAEAACRQALTLDPRLAQAAVNLASALVAQDRHAEAEQALRYSLALHPGMAVAENNLGNVLLAQGRAREAAEAYRRALAIAPAYADAARNLERLLAAAGQQETPEACNQRSVDLLARRHFATAETAARQALALRPQYPEALYNLGLALKEQGQVCEAIAAYRQALALAPQFARAENNLGVALASLGQFAEAEAAYLRALALTPDVPETHKNLGQALQSQGRLDEALAACQRALALRPEYDWAENNLGVVLKEQGRVEEAVAAFRRALHITPGFVAAHSNLLMELHNLSGTTPAELARAHAEWDERHGRPLQVAWRAHATVPDPARPLRLGLVSADFFRHPVGYFLVAVLESLDRAQCVTTCYSNRPSGDDLTARIAAAADTWRQVHGLSDEALAEQIRGDQIDILFDLAGHTSGNRLLTFVRKPAPIQMSWMGYVGTTGLAAMDYVVADHYQAPAGAEQHYQERIVRLPDDYICYSPPDYAPPCVPPPVFKCGTVTFGSFNNLAKINRQVLEVWATILNQIPGSRLLIKFRGLDDAGNQRRYRELFCAAGGDVDRIDLKGQAPHVELLRSYQRIDIALDPFPYSGGLTTCEALWMGVPVITCPGATFASRHAFSHLTNAGCGELVASDFADYIAKAVNLASDQSRLAQLHGELRTRMAQSPLCDVTRFARNFEAALRTTWQAWCSEHIAPL